MFYYLQNDFSLEFPLWKERRPCLRKRPCPFYLAMSKEAIGDAPAASSCTIRPRPSCRKRMHKRRDLGRPWPVVVFARRVDESLAKDELAIAADGKAAMHSMEKQRVWNTRESTSRLPWQGSARSRCRNSVPAIARSTSCRQDLSQVDQPALASLTWRSFAALRRRHNGEWLCDASHSTAFLCAPSACAAVRCARARSSARPIRRRCRLLCLSPRAVCKLPGHRSSRGLASSRGSSIHGKFAQGSNILRTANPSLYFQMTARGEDFFQTAYASLRRPKPSLTRSASIL